MAAQLNVVPDSSQLARAAAECLVRAVAAGARTVALSGGSTPKAMLQLLAGEFAHQVDWPSIEIYFVDERCVPPDHAESNFKMANDALLSKVPIKAENIHRMKGEIDAETAAVEYGRLLEARFGDGGCDLTFLGMGDDGHTASLFPHTPAVREVHHRCVAQFVEKSTTGQSWRLTQTAPFINRSKEVVVLLGGAGKAERLKEVLEGPRDPERLPIQLIAPSSGKMTWLLDESAARKLANRE
jgi:6-phosphogluconolactonase